MAVDSDGVLLEQFLKDHNQDAFAALMKRHGPYLLAVCRQLTKHTQDAEDVFQACFLQLIRKGRSIRRSSSVAGWLQRVAVRLAHKVRTRRARQRQKDAEIPIIEAVATPADLSWREACQILQEEIAVLPEDLRLPIILCFFQGHSQEEAGQELGINPRTVKDRLRRGRERLHERLLTRGVALSILGTLLASGFVEGAIPSALEQATLQGVVAATTKTTLAGAVSPSVVGLTGSSLGFAGWISIATAAALTLGTVASVVAWDWFEAPPEPMRAEARVLRKVQRSFGGKRFDAEFLQWTGRNAEQYIQPEDEGLRITLPEKDGPGDAIGVKLRHRVRGDIEIEATFDFLQVPRPAEGSGGGVSVYLYLDSAERDGIWLGKVNDSLRGPLFNTGQRVWKDKDRVNKFITNVPAITETGWARVRVVRNGSTMSMFAAEGEAGEFVPFASVEVSAADCTIVRFAADPIWRRDVAIDIRLVDLTISAEEFVGYEPR